MLLVLGPKIRIIFDDLANILSNYVKFVIKTNITPTSNS